MSSQLLPDNFACYITQMEITSENVQEVINSLARSVQQGEEDDQITINIDVIARVLVSARDIVETTNIPLQQLVNVCYYFNLHSHWQNANLYVILTTGSHSVSTLQKQVGCFNHRVVALVADKLERQWLLEVCFDVED